MSAPVAYIRFRSDGGFEGPIAAGDMGNIRLSSRAWTALYPQSELDRLAAENAELKAANAELERLCDETYVAKGADAYNHACELSEEFDAKREARGLAPIFGSAGSRSLCDGLSSLFKQFEALEKRVPPDGWVAVGWLTECVWEDGTSYSFSYNEPKPIPTSTGMISQRIGRAYFDTTRPNPSAQARSTPPSGGSENTDG